MSKGVAVVALAFVASLACSSCSDDPSSLGTGARRSGTSGSSGASSGDTSSGGSSGDTGSSGGTGSSGSSGTSGTSGASGATGTTAAEICVATINEYRKTKGLAPYARWTENEACSDTEAASDAITKKPHGAFGKCGESAQNECPGWQGPAETMIPQCLKSMWGEGPGGGHYDAMASTRYTKVACGFGTASGGGIWAVQNFR